MQNKKFFLHLLGSIAFLSLPVLLSPDINMGWNLFRINPFLNHFSQQFFLLTLFYVNYYWLIPNYFFGKNPTLYYYLFNGLFLALILTIPSYFFPFHMGENKLPPNAMMGEIPPMKSFPKPKNGIFGPFMEGGIFKAGLILGLSYLLKMNQRFSELKNEKLSAEVSYLKAQINPHFLFNTLNSLYALTLQKSDEASKAVLKLSGIMRYVVVESSKEHVSLSKEINYIQDYIELQKLRLDESVNLKVNIEGDSNNKQIAPLVLIPFIENAFKYGINPDEQSYISILIKIFENELYLEVENSIVNAEISEEFKTEQGIENTLKRLEFIYPKKHQFRVFESETVYTIQLKIYLE
ncbi:sensor histidine kinase [Flavobacterium sp. N1719]|uniref:sensor histidine kinase n=1 Tax=Flavobacterium sp. N1719 TaxID=2885633 RepID=UPI002221D5B3|nr:histidine kinase [Flavobacterium sp. N1719]